jgi:hypothetical protein
MRHEYLTLPDDRVLDIGYRDDGSEVFVSIADPPTWGDPDAEPWENDGEEVIVAARQYADGRYLPLVALPGREFYRWLARCAA